MTLGNLFLDWHSRTSSPGDAHSSIQNISGENSSSSPLYDAERMFRDSVALVADQFAVHKVANRDETPETKEAIFRSLLLLRGRAETNVAITLIELATAVRSLPKAIAGDSGAAAARSDPSSALLSEAAALLERTVDGAMRSRSPPPVLSSSSSSTPCRRDDDNAKRGGAMTTTAEHLVLARELEVLAARRRGDALWLLGRRDEGLRVQEGAAMSALVDPVGNGPSPAAETIRDKINLLVEGYYAATSLINHATTAVENVPLARLRAPSKGKARKEDGLIEAARRGFAHAAQISDKISHLTNLSTSPLTFQEICDSCDVESTADLAASARDLAEWWRERKSAGSSGNDGRRFRSLLPPTPILRRGFLASDGTKPSSGGGPPARIVLPDGGPTRGISKRGRVGRNGGAQGQAPSSRENADTDGPFNAVSSSAFNGSNCGVLFTTRKHKTFRKWGDELLPQAEVGGGMLARFPYPACAPELPHRIPAIKGFVPPSI